MGGKLLFKLFDDDFSGDELVGSFSFLAKDIMGEMNGNYFWKNVYGAPLDYSGKNCDRMNDNPNLASLWKGRILMQVYAEKTEKPILMMRDMEVTEVNKAAVHLAPKKYEFAI